MNKKIRKLVEGLNPAEIDEIKYVASGGSVGSYYAHKFVKLGLIKTYHEFSNSIHSGIGCDITDKGKKCRLAINEMEIEKIELDIAKLRAKIADLEGERDNLNHIFQREARYADSVC